MKKNAHICVEAVTGYLPARIREITYIVAQIVFLLFAALVVRKASCWEHEDLQVRPIVGRARHADGVIYLAPTVGFALVFIRLVQNIVADSSALRTFGVAA